MADIDLTSSGSSVNLTTTSGDTAIFSAGSPEGSGTGSYGTFLSTQSQGTTGTAEGFNSDEQGNPLDTNSAKTESLLLSDLQQVEVNGTFYYLFRLDLNESPDTVSLNELKIYTSAAPATQGDFNNTTDELGAGFTKVFDLDQGEDRTLLLTDANATGSGTDDYSFLIPVSAFDGATGYVTFYTNWGQPSHGSNQDPYAEDGGFDEWAALLNGGGDNSAPSVNVEKTGDPTAIDEGSDTQITYTYVVTNTSAAGAADPLTLTSLVDDNATLGDSSDDIDLLQGFVAGSDYGDYYVSGDTDGDYLVDSDETWTFSATVNSGVHTAADGAITNTVVVHAHDDDSTDDVTDSDDATVTVNDVAPSVNVEKTADPTAIDEGSDTQITYTYVVTNTSAAGAADPLTLTSLVDDNATPGDSGDDIDLLQGFVAGSDYGDYYVSGDTDGDYLVDSDETWTFSATVNSGVHTAADGAITNTVVVHAHDDDSTDDVTDSAEATVTVNDVAPSVNVEKTVDANGDGIFNELEMIQAFGHSATYKYELTNTSPAGAADPLAIDSLVDDRGTVSTADDVILVSGGVTAANVTFSGDANNNGLLDVGETWTYVVDIDVNLNPGQTLTNTVTVGATDDEGATATDTDTAAVQAFEGPGVRTPGFWSNLGKQFWDGNATNQTKSGPNFPGGELTYAVDHDNDHDIGTAKTAGLLIGDYNKNGMTDAGEDTFFISLNDATKLINASTKELQDTRWVLGRDAVATWLNYLAGNPIDNQSYPQPDPNSPHSYLDQAIDWLQSTSGGGASSLFEDWGGGSAVKANDSKWTVGFNTEDATAGNELAGNLIHQELDFYNNTGTTHNGLYVYANDGG